MTDQTVMMALANEVKGPKAGTILALFRALNTLLQTAYPLPAFASETDVDAWFQRISPSMAKVISLTAQFFGGSTPIPPGPGPNI